jgi:hypothetical protein
MNPVKLIEFFRQRLKTVVAACLGLLALLMLADLVMAMFGGHEEAHTAIEHVPCFWSIFGFLGCVLIIYLSKWYGHAGIMTREDYYEQPEQKEIGGHTHE